MRENDVILLRKAIGSALRLMSKPDKRNYERQLYWSINQLHIIVNHVNRFDDQSRLRGDWIVIAVYSKHNVQMIHQFVPMPTRDFLLKSDYQLTYRQAQGLYDWIRLYEKDANDLIISDGDGDMIMFSDGVATLKLKDRPIKSHAHDIVYKFFLDAKYSIRFGALDLRGWKLPATALTDVQVVAEIEKLNSRIGDPLLVELIQRWREQKGTDDRHSTLWEQMRDRLNDLAPEGYHWGWYRENSKMDYGRMEEKQLGFYQIKGYFTEDKHEPAA